MERLDMTTNGGTEDNDVTTDEEIAALEEATRRIKEARATVQEITESLKDKK
jgi:hypothetical protein